MDRTTEEGPVLIGSGELAARLGYSVSGLKKMERQGVIPEPPRMVGSNQRVYRESDVALIEQRIKDRRAARSE
jgi:DNA-binding transcriptional MerR regulator